MLKKNNNNNHYNNIIDKGLTYIIYFIAVAFILFLIKLFKTTVVYRSFEKKILFDVKNIKPNDLDTGDLLIMYTNANIMLKHVAGFGFYHTALIIYDDFNKIHYMYDITLQGIRFQNLDNFLSRYKNRSDSHQIFIKKLYIKDCVKEYYKKQIIRWTHMQYYKPMWYAFNSYIYFFLKIVEFNKNNTVDKYYDNYQFNDEYLCKNYKTMFNKKVDKIVINKKKIKSRFLNCVMAIFEIYHNSNIINLEKMIEYKSRYPADFLIDSHMPWSNKNLIMFDPNLYKILY